MTLRIVSVRANLWEVRVVEEVIHEMKSNELIKTQ